MKANYLLLILVFLVKILYAQNYKTNDVLNDTIWASDTVKIYNDVTVTQGATLTINPGAYVEFQGNYSLTVNGRIKAIGTQLDSITFTIHDTTSFGDTSTLSGGWGSIKLLNNPLDTSFFSYCVFSYGKAVDPGYSVYGNYNDNFMGGAIFAYQYANLKCNNSTFFHNRAIEYGGGIFVKYYAVLEFSNNLFKKNNSLFEGGAIKIESGNTAIISENKFIKNRTFNDGYNEWGYWVGGAGGGIYVGVNSNAIVMNNWFCNNNAVNGSLYETDYNCFILNNIIINNKGVGLFNGDEIGTPKYINNTIVNNLSYDFVGGIVFFSPFIEMRNNIVYGNEGEWDYPSNEQIWTPRTNIQANFSYGCNPDEPIYYQGVGNIHDDPMFVNPTEGAGPDYDGMAADWSFLPGSPCINSGTSDTTGLNLPAFDLVGNPRVYGGRVDMGAYEKQYFITKINDSPVYNTIKLYPNPGNNRMVIEILPGMEEAEIEIVDNFGKVCMHEHIHSSPAVFYPDRLAPGIYYYRIFNPTGTMQSGKWVKQ